MERTWHEVVHGTVQWWKWELVTVSELKQEGGTLLCLASTASMHTGQLKSFAALGMSTKHWIMIWGWRINFSNKANSQIKRTRQSLFVSSVPPRFGYHQTPAISHPGTLSFPKDLGDRPVQSLQGHQRLGCMVEARLVTLQVAFLRGGRVGYCQVTVTWMPGPVWHRDSAVDKTVISHFAGGSGRLKSILQSCFGTLGHKVGSAVRVQLWKQQSLLKKSVSQACQLIVYQFLNKLLVNKDLHGAGMGSLIDYGECKLW